ncbi:MAG: Ppx/GppA family phosphatase, partial [Defluviicoccus sp.]|nr:Ppx/GppA family phosphatase [Defluviicoccus sp.]
MDHRPGHRARSSPTAAGRRRRRGRTIAALDLGTNNCRLLIARPSVDGFQVIDGFSRIVRLGQGLEATG